MSFVYRFNKNFSKIHKSLLISNPQIPCKRISCVKINNDRYSSFHTLSVVQKRPEKNRDFKYATILASLTIIQCMWIFMNQDEVFADLHSKYDYYYNTVNDTKKAFEISDPNQFYTIYRNKDCDIFLDVFAPWCKYCVIMEPEYNKFVNVLVENNVENIVVVKWDKDRFKPPVQVSSVPTIIFIAAGEEGYDLRHYNFNRNRTAKDFAQFIVDAGGKSAPAVKELLRQGLFD